MKKIILSAALLSVITVFTSAQTTLKPSEKNSNIFRMAKSQNDQKTSSTSQQLNNRKNYHFKNGQESTPTGREAGSVNGDEFISLNRDTNDQSKK